ncbi:MAG: L,D-transpeptidase family protein [Cohaesibacter sp.]|jgi:L,D-peptidoglycan transpeptidase YkuD (ErfK/YbiS/YcfS/YnhG family)|nr:L,D-transpeptidase family protein [Cohaesibacter sp.]
MNHITIRVKPGSRTKGFLKLDNKVFPCALGRGGISSQKREGDGATPLLNCRPLWGFYRPDKGPKPESRLPFIALSPRMGWCDEIGHARYNQLVDLPFSESHEIMWRNDCLYDIGVVLDYNITARTQGAGSAIFFHIARDGFTPTEGCVAVTHKAMRQLLRHITPDTHFRVMT